MSHMSMICKNYYYNRAYSHFKRRLCLLSSKALDKEHFEKIKIIKLNNNECDKRSYLKSNFKICEIFPVLNSKISLIINFL